MLLTMKIFILLAALACSALCQNAEPARRIHELRGSPVASDLDAQRDDFWETPPEGGKESPGNSQHGNENSPIMQQQQLESPSPNSSTRLSAHSGSASSRSESRHPQSSEDRKKKRRRAKQPWRDRADPKARENLVNVGGRNRLKKKQHEALSTTAFGSAKKTRSRTGKFREERRRRRRNRKRMRSRLRLENRRTDTNYDDSPMNILMKILKQQMTAQQSTNLEDNPLNLSMTRFGEINEATKILEPSNLTSSYPSQLTTESRIPEPPEPTSHYKPLPVEREFSRHVEREFAESVAARQRDEQEETDVAEEEDEADEEEDNSAELPRFDERYQQSTKQPDDLKPPFDPERMLGYSRTDEDLPILDMENEVLQRTMKDYNAYMSSSVMKNDKVQQQDSHRERHKPQDNESNDRDALLTDDDDPRGDLSCINGTFIPAPFVRHAVIKYFKSSRPDHEYLEADYECESGYVLVTSNASNNRLLCHDRRWIGRLPVCRYHGDDEDKRPTCAELGCQQLCRIVDDRAECSCHQGFRQEGLKCVDINECESNEGRGPCEDTCRNTEGSFECSCETRPATQLAADKRTCQQPITGPCSYNNAGCSHTCLASMGRVFCLCPDGFMLEDDWKTCQDVNECAVPDLQTEVCRYGCINTPGSYRCAPPPLDSLHDQFTAAAAARPSPECQPGYQLNPAAKNCVDIDECATNNGGCSEICENTEGSFFCACEGDERILLPDRRTCVVAEQRFLKMDREAALSLRFRQAGGVSCSALNPAGRGYLICSDSVDTASNPKQDESSDEDQDEDEDEQEERTNVDQEDNERERIPIRPGTKCHLKCPHGYELHGEYELTCRADGTWDGPKHGECLRYSKPRLDCPKDVVAELPPARDEAFVTYGQPSTDLDWFRYVRSKPSWGTRLEANLKLGIHEITFYARHPVSKKQTSCTLKITVQEGQAPKVENCPSDIEVTGKNGSAITWAEPIFTDNVKVTRVTSTKSPGQTFSLGGHKVEYEAADEAGWTTKCIFTVVLRPLTQ